MPAPEPLALDLRDFDALGLATTAVVALRAHAIEAGIDTAATVAAPEGWHRVVVTARSSGHVVLSVRFDDLTMSRYHNIAGALARRGWDPDEDGEGATHRFPPGTEAAAAAFEVLAVVPLAGAPSGVREVTAVDGAGRPVDLH